MLVSPALVDVDATDARHPQLIEDVPQQFPGWVRVEPWNALLCVGAGVGTGEGGGAVAARRRAEELQVCIAVRS